MTGDQINTTRHRLGLTAAQLAELLHVSAATVYKWENKGKQPAGVTSTTGMILSQLVPAIEAHANPSLIGTAVKAQLAAAGSFSALVMLMEQIAAIRR